METASTQRGRPGLQDVEGLLASRLRGLVRDLEEHRLVRRLEDGLGPRRAAPEGVLGTKCASELVCSPRCSYNGVVPNVFCCTFLNFSTAFSHAPLRLGLRAWLGLLRREDGESLVDGRELLSTYVRGGRYLSRAGPRMTTVIRREESTEKHERAKQMEADHEGACSTRRELHISTNQCDAGISAYIDRATD